MAWSYISGTSRSCSDGGNNVTTVAADTTTANFIVIQAVGQANASLTISDSQSNTWTALTAQTGQVPNSRLYYVYAPSTSASHTFTISSSFQYPSIHVAWFSGAASSPFDTGKENGASGTSNFLSTGSTGSLTDNDELIIAGMGYQDTTTISIDSGFTMIGQTPLVGGQSFGGGIARKIKVGSSTAENPQFSWTTGASSTAVIAAFRAAAAASITGPLVGFGHLGGGGPLVGGRLVRDRVRGPAANSPIYQPTLRESLKYRRAA